MYNAFFIETSTFSKQQAGDASRSGCIYVSLRLYLEKKVNDIFLIYI